MANKKKRRDKHSEGMKKPSKRPKLFSKKERSGLLRKMTSKQPPKNASIDHRSQDSQHLRRGDR